MRWVFEEFAFHGVLFGNGQMGTIVLCVNFVLCGHGFGNLWWVLVLVVYWSLTFVFWKWWDSA